MKVTGRRFAVIGVLLLMLLVAVPISASAGFVQTADGVKYTTSAGKTVTGLKKIGKKYYLFDGNGIMLHGIQKVGAKQYFFDLRTGARRYGWITYAGAKYYANKKTGVLYVNRGKGKFYFGADGALVKGGKAATLVGWVRGSKTYYYDENHQKVTGLRQIGSRTYYFNGKGVLQKKKIVKSGGVRYYVGPKGYVLKNRFVTVKNRKYYAQADGSLAAGVVSVGSAKYCFKSNGQLSGRGFITLDGARYFVQKNGKIAANRWIKYKKKYYWCDPDGKVATNRYIGSYYVGTDGVRVKAQRPASGVTSRDGRTYIYGTDGYPVSSQWYSTSDGKRYYVGADGAAVTGLQIIGGYKYYFNAAGVLQTDSVLFANGYCYYTSPSDAHIVSESAVNGNAVVSYAKQFVGNPYVYGGTSLTNGTDCSGFSQQVMLHFGVRIMRVAADQMNGATSYYASIGYANGIQVSDANLQPGDLVFYGSGSYATHVAIYMGNNQVVHAANSRVGIIISGVDWVKGRLHNKNRRYWAG